MPGTENPVNEIDVTIESSNWKNYYIKHSEFAQGNYFYNFIENSTDPNLKYKLLTGNENGLTFIDLAKSSVIESIGSMQITSVGMGCDLKGTLAGVGDMTGNVF